MKPIFNRTPLAPNTFTPLSVGAIHPEDWLLEQIQMQAEGISHQYDALCSQIGADGEWLADENGDFSTAVYYLDGMILLGWTLGMEAYQNRAKKMVEWILAGQRENGWFGPAENEDYWPLMLAIRALRNYFSAECDKRVLVLMDRFFKYAYRRLEDHPMQDWAVARGGEMMESALWLYNITGQEYLLKLCRKLQQQTLDWTNFFHTFSNPMPMSKSQRWDRLKEGIKEEKDEPLVGEKRPYFHSQFHFTQGVNIAMGLKTPGVISMFKSGFKEQGGFRFGMEKLMKHHGLANGMFSCDAHINGSNPTQGVSLNAMVEMLNTLETLLGIGDFGMDVADALEKIAYNALPAAFNADMTAYQRLQQANQIRISTSARKWYSEDENANLFSFAKNDLDCASCHQAWPKFAASQWYASNDGGLAAVSYAPCTVRANLGGVPVRLRVSGGYPFNHTVEISVSTKQPSEFPLYLRIPFWARQAMIYLPGGEIMQVRSNEYTCVRRKWITGDVLRIELPASPRITRWYHQSAAVEVGPLLMALKPEAVWQDTPAGLSAYTEDAWNRALVRDEPMKLIQIPEDISTFGKGESAVSVMVKGAKIDWAMDGASCASVPMVPKLEKSAQDILELVPYGEAPLRISEFPIGTIKEDKQKNIIK